MLFSEMMFGEEEIFADYYEGRTYFRLKQAYLAYVSREYVVCGRQVKGCVFTIIANIADVQAIRNQFAFKLAYNLFLYAGNHYVRDFSAFGADKMVMLRQNLVIAINMIRQADFAD